MLYSKNAVIRIETFKKFDKVFSDMESFNRRNALGTMKGMADFHRFKSALTQIHRDETLLKELISRFLRNPSNQLQKEVAERRAYLLAEMEAFREMTDMNGMDGVFFLAESGGRISEVLEEADRILRNVSLHA